MDENSVTNKTIWHPYFTIPDPRFVAGDQLWKRGQYQRERYARKRREILEFLGGICVHCGFSDSRALQVDHIEGGGNKERKEVAPRSGGPGASTLWNLVHASPEKYQLLCANCNMIKG